MPALAQGPEHIESVKLRFRYEGLLRVPAFSVSNIRMVAECCCTMRFPTTTKSWQNLGWSYQRIVRQSTTESYEALYQLDAAESLLNMALFGSCCSRLV